ncbi:hypothetical protein SFRURICE_012757 [Spodoptera frugiperda]|nr:hypothetical protein SFRURICE_012757 [Spodoptera frugiperda]
MFVLLARCLLHTHLFKRLNEIGQQRSLFFLSVISSLAAWLQRLWEYSPFVEEGHSPTLDYHGLLLHEAR